MFCEDKDEEACRPRFCECPKQGRLHVFWDKYGMHVCFCYGVLTCTTVVLEGPSDAPCGTAVVRHQQWLTTGSMPINKVYDSDNAEMEQDNVSWFNVLQLSNLIYKTLISNALILGY